MVNMKVVKKMKAQAAMEYLMTYGWAILIVIIVAAALYMLGVFNPATYTQATATGFPGFNVPSGGWKFDSGGTLTLQLKNMVGSNINITSVQATYGGSTRTNSTASGTLGPNADIIYVVSGFGTQTAGSAYTISVDIIYDNLDSGLTGFRSTGTVTGVVS
jgi:uncharacterized protein (UPF0333 family)